MHLSSVFVPILAFASGIHSARIPRATAAPQLADRSTVLASAENALCDVLGFCKHNVTVTATATTTTTLPPVTVLVTSSSTTTTTVISTATAPCGTCNDRAALCCNSYDPGTGPNQGTGRVCYYASTGSINLPAGNDVEPAGQWQAYCDAIPSKTVYACCPAVATIGYGTSGAVLQGFVCNS